MSKFGEVSPFVTAELAVLGLMILLSDLVAFGRMNPRPDLMADTVYSYELVVLFGGVYDIYFKCDKVPLGGGKSVDMSWLDDTSSSLSDVRSVTSIETLWTIALNELFSLSGHPLSYYETGYKQLLNNDLNVFITSK